MAEILLYAAIFAATYWGVKLFAVWSRRRRKFFDVPNERSSHTNPTPRGGGLIVVVVSLSSYAVYSIYFTKFFYWQYLAGACLIAAVSWLDDVRSVWFGWRFAVHTAAALLLISGLSRIVILGAPAVAASPIVQIIIGAFVVLWIVWLTNAYNFMDGIDGIAALQALTAGIGWLSIGKILNLETVGALGGALAFSSLGFLLLNWSPAKIFMGDVGSAFLGYSFAAMPFLSMREGALKPLHLFFAGVALVWLFVFDTAFTLIRRLLKSENIWQAHRSHIYQQLVLNGFSHSQTAAFYGILSAANAASVAACFVNNRFIYLSAVFLAGESIALTVILVRAKKIGSGGKT